MRKFLLITIFLTAFSVSNFYAQVNARLFQYPDVSQTHITFSYAGDIWVTPKTGGTASKLTSPKGNEGLAKFSPDGSTIAFVGNYDGNTNIYTIPAMGGMPARVTYHGMYDRLLGWYPDGKSILFASSRESGKQRFSQFYKISTKGGIAEKLPVPYGEFGEISIDGKWLAYTPKSRAYRTWKRYAGGMAADVWLFNLETMQSENITNNNANDEFPMWNGDKVYFLSDRGTEKRANIFVYDVSTKETRQITFFKDFDIHFPSIGNDDMVFEAGGKLYLLNLADEKYNEVKINVVTDHITLMPRVEKAGKLLQGGTISPDGKRGVIAARGELFSVPAENGPIYNLTNSSGVMERSPAWSPDGKHLAYWSDKSGEYELTLRSFDNITEEKKLTSYGAGFRYELYWSPDSKKIVFIDQTMTIYYYDLDKNKTVQVDKQKYLFQGGLNDFSVSWSSDSRWIAYGKELDNRSNALYLFDTKEEKQKQLTTGFYSDTDPAFDPDGKYLYFTSNRSFTPVYSDLDNSFIYPNTTQIAALPLTADVPSPLAPKNDMFEAKKEDKKDEKKDDDKKDEKSKEVKIDFTNIEERIVVLPPAAGNYGSLSAVSGKVIYHRRPNSGSADKDKPVVYYDLEKREEKTVVPDADSYGITANGKKMAVVKSGSIYIVDIAPDQKLKEKMPLDKLEMTVNPHEEWKQIFTDVWRLQRDFFYDKNMHGVDWDAKRKQYGKLIDDAVTRDDVNYIIGELIGELNASHTYRGGGDVENEARRAVGYLGVDWELQNGAYRISKIIKPASWETEVKSPLAESGINVKEGDYILAVNGMPLDVTKEPYAAFEGLAGDAVELTVNSKPNLDGARKVVVETLKDETRLRNLAWIEANRKRVEEATNGKVGYIFVPSTGRDGQTELVRQFAAQFDKEGLIIDERFNNGGQIPDRFIELLNRKALAYWAVRDGAAWQWPPVANFGPKVMLINGWSGSGGDAFPDYFKKAGLGKLIGERTWGGLIGITGAPGLIDGGYVTVPTFRMYDPDGKWFKEGYGVDPDIAVVDDPTQLAKGTDPQLERAIQEVMQQLPKGSSGVPKAPAYEKR